MSWLKRDLVEARTECAGSPPPWIRRITAHVVDNLHFEIGSSRFINA